MFILFKLGWRENAWESVVHGFDCDSVWKIFAQDTVKCHPVESYRMTVGELVAESKRVKHEGFVFYTADGVSAKIKSPYYLTSKWVARNPRTDKLVNMEADIKKNLDEEYYPLVDAIRANIVEYTALDEQARLVWVRNYLETV